MSIMINKNLKRKTYNLKKKIYNFSIFIIISIIYNLIDESKCIIQKTLFHWRIINSVYTKYI